MTRPWRFQTRFSVIALSSSASRSDVKPASLGEMESQSVPAAAVVRIDCPMNMAPVPTRIFGRLGFGPLRTAAHYVVKALTVKVAQGARRSEATLLKQGQDFFDRRCSCGGALNFYKCVVAAAGFEPASRS